MLYQNLVTNKIIRVLRFRQEGSLDRCRTLVPEMINNYQVPKFLKRDVYFMVLLRWFHGLRDSEIRSLLNEAYPTEKTPIKKDYN